MGLSRCVPVSGVNLLGTQQPLMYRVLGLRHGLCSGAVIRGPLSTPREAQTQAERSMMRLSTAKRKDKERVTPALGAAYLP